MKLRRIMIAALIGATLPAMADKCEIHLMVADMDQTADVPSDVNNMIKNQLKTAITSSNTGVVADPDFDQFFIGARVTHLYKDVLAGPPQQDVIHSTLTLYIGDILNQKEFASAQVELRGVGQGEVRAYTNAIRQLNGRNREIQKLIETGKTKIINYYDQNYQNILAKADRAISMKNYDEAIYYAMAIPECCKGYQQANAVVLKAYHGYIDNEGNVLLAKARAEWATHPDEYGAEAAMSYLTQIDPDASCYNQAIALGKEISERVKRNWDFENRQKYQDSVALDKQRIEAARAVGVAYGNGQKPTTTNLMWLR